MVRYLEDKMRGAIFCDPNFVANFLAIDKEKLHLLEKELSKRLKNTQAMLDDSITAEHQLYGPILGVLRSIKEAADTVRATHNLEALGTNFEDYHATTISGDNPDTQLIKPDLVLFEDDGRDQRRWETLMMPIEVKAKRTYRKVGIKQLTRYARAVFAHQIHRRHLYGMVICKWSATFVRFDRSGIVHSEPIDMLANPKGFQRAFAGLMMLDRSAFGYDTAFTTEPVPGGRQEYYVDLPDVAFPFDNTNLAPIYEPPAAADSTPGSNSPIQLSASRQLSTRKFRVMERLCHRKSIHGRATIVLRLREVQNRSEQSESATAQTSRMTRSRTQSQKGQPKWEEVPGGREYVLKLMWRDPNKRQEGEILKHLEGEYGVAQCQWYSNVLLWGASCHEPGAPSCDECCDVTPAQAVVRPVKNLEDLDVVVAEEEEGKEPQYAEVETDDYVGELYTHRMARIYTWVLFSSVGRLLWTAESPCQFLEAVLDSILGYWQVFNRGILHRDISDGNVLIADPGRGYKLRKWKLDQESKVRDGQQSTGAQNHPLAESRRLAHETIEQLERDPSGFLSDYDLAATHNGMESELFGRTCASDGNPISLISDTGDTASMGPPMKRPRRDSSSASFNFSIGTGWEKVTSEEPGLSPIIGPNNKAFKQIDFRTGTPTFMSTRILQITIGSRYEHHFMDDLESFFWLILWCVVQHVDLGPDDNENNNVPAQRALELLKQLDRADSDFEGLAGAKQLMLTRCHTGKIKTDLKDCGNTWAHDPTIVRVILELGDYFFKLTIDDSPLSQYVPETVFPQIVGILSEALKEMRLGLQSPVAQL
ncbi:unnamed protein product [Rhizoctonia solani]|nr:unnamed protein product [Rhizoctonia solani]